MTFTTDAVKASSSVSGSALGNGTTILNLKGSLLIFPPRFPSCLGNLPPALAESPTGSGN